MASRDNQVGQGQSGTDHSGHVLVAWEDITTPGAYVEELSGDLFRIPQEALTTGSTNGPSIGRLANHEQRLLKVSDDPYAPAVKCRMEAANHNIQPSF
jgi:hypothetical protein